MEWRGLVGFRRCFEGTTAGFPDGLTVEGETRRDRERGEEKRQREELIHVSATCVGGKGTEPGTLVVPSENSVWVTGNIVVN